MTAESPDDVRAVAFVGPTAAGKAALGRIAAQRLGLPILVCDSVKVYRRLDIGSSKPDATARTMHDFRLLDLVDADATFSAGDYARHAWDELRAAQGRGLFVGGTGFYLRAVGWTHSGEDTPGVDRPPDDPTRVVFEQRWAQAERDRPGAMHRALSAADPTLAGTIHPNNHVRLLRALWLIALSGGSLSEQRRRDPPRPRLRLMLVVVDPGPEALGARIDARLDRMLAEGFLREVESLYADGYDGRNKAMRSLGYRQMLDVVEGRCTVAQARDAIAVATRQYAKRQRTYFRSQLPADRIVSITEPSACPWPAIDGFLNPRRET